MFKRVDATPIQECYLQRAQRSSSTIYGKEKHHNSKVSLSLCDFPYIIFSVLMLPTIIICLIGWNSYTYQTNYINFGIALYIVHNVYYLLEEIPH